MAGTEVKAHSTTAVPAANWPQLYLGLLRESRVPAAEIQQTLVAGGNSPPTSGPTLAQCLAQPQTLYARFDSGLIKSASARQLRAWVSVLQQDLALTVIAPLTTRLLLNGSAPAPEATGIVLTSRDLPGQWQVQAEGSPLSPAKFVKVMAERVREWYPPFRQVFGVSPGAYWSSVGLGLSAPFSALYDRAPPQLLCELATAWLSRFDCEAKHFIDWIPATLGGHSCALPQRRGCCLKYLLPEGGYCGTCGVYRKQRLGELSRPLQPEVWQPEG